MDVVRSCYRTTCQFFSDADYPLPITWYRCAPGAKAFPVGHAFGSRNWDPIHDLYDGVGEVSFAPRPWRNGATPAGALGQHFCGELEWFQQGAPFSESTATVRLPSGLLGCCVPELVVSRDVAAGEASGGGLLRAFTPDNPCGEPTPPPVLFVRVNAPTLAYLFLRKTPRVPSLWGTLIIFGPDLYAPSDACTIFPPVGGVYLAVSCTGSGGGPPALVTTVALNGRLAGLPRVCWLDVTVQTVPFGDGRAVTAGEVSGGGVESPPTAYRQVTAGEVSGGGVDWHVVTFPIAGEVSGGGVSH